MQVQELRTRSRSLFVRAVRGTRRRAARLVLAKAPTPVKPAARPSGARQPKQPKPPRVSVVIAVDGTAADLDACLSSVLSQSLRSMEVIAVHDGADDAALDVLRRFAAEDARLALLRTDGPGREAARSQGALQARGTYLAFVEPPDVLPPKALAQLVGSLQKSQSDVAVGALRRVLNGRGSRPAWNARVHQADQIGVTVEDFPLLLQDVGAPNRVYRRAFWTQIASTVEGAASAQPLLVDLAASLGARSVDVLKAVTYERQVRSDQIWPAGSRDSLDRLENVVPQLRLASELVLRDAPPAAVDAWLGGVLDHQLGRYLEQAVRADAGAQTLLREAVATFAGLATTGAWDHVSVSRRIQLWLAEHERWSALERCVEYFRLHGQVPPTEVVDGHVVAALPLDHELSGIEPWRLRLSPGQTRLTACVEKCWWDDDGSLVLEGWAFIRAIDLTVSSPELEAALVHPVDGRRVAVPVTPLVSPQATRWANLAFQNIDRSGFRMRIDVDQLAQGEPPAAPLAWTLEVTNRTLGVERTGPIRSVVLSGVGGRMRARPLRSLQDRVRIVPLLDPTSGFAVQVRPDRVRGQGLVAGPGHQVRGGLRLVNPVASPVVAVRASCASSERESPVERHDDGTLSFQLDLSGEEGSNTSWTFRAVAENGQLYRMAWPDEATAGERVGDLAGPVLWLRSPRGYAELLTGPAVITVTALEVRDAAVVADLELSGLGTEVLTDLTLQGAATSVAGTAEPGAAPGLHRVRFPLRTSIWGTPDLPVPVGTYRITTADGLVAGVASDFLEQCPVFGRTAEHAYAVARIARQDELSLRLVAPLADEERGRQAQRRWAAWYGELEVPPLDAVLFQCYRGEFATDTQRAVHEELRRRGSSLDLLWAVASFSVPLPEGAQPVLIGSRAWYEAVAGARYLCQNIDYDRFFRKRPHQRYLQTFHGYPWKSMGASLWAAQGRAESLIAFECERRNADWDAILVPEEFCVDLYREQYRYQHEVLVTGYPRNDSLVRSDPQEARAEVLRRLGIDERKTVVLYAPTWRDTSATSAWTAEFSTELDLLALTEQLGEDYAVLVRGHNYHLRGGSQIAEGRVVDVSSYPEINDLILAADVAVLDYSSLRFDWLITGKPVLFFVPDLEEYLRSRTVLFDFEPTAPGPKLASTAEVIAALRELDAVSERHAAARQAFNDRYNRLHDGHAAERVVDAFFA